MGHYTKTDLKSHQEKPQERHLIRNVKTGHKSHQKQASNHTKKMDI